MEFTISKTDCNISDIPLTTTKTRFTMADAVWAVPSRPFVRHLIESGAVVSSFCVRQFTTYNSRLTPEVWWPTVHTLIFSVHVKLSPSHRIGIVEAMLRQCWPAFVMEEKRE